ncbi:hypothetical protein PIROE2DRAFT_16221 [Piromyces sp. E2]|nr:hypothetical protein PIROE2DRAFT_16221 [Piromyces sp. E2]|eukprot:OUM58479.1 hypothetical protein PIROE2DRAFT_16221 [Piromyces sp. E2]
MKLSVITVKLLTLLFYYSYCLGKNPDNDIVIIYTNDVHGAVDEKIGYAGVSSYRKKVEENTPYVTLVDVGDAIQGATIGAISQGEYIIDIMNTMEYDIAVPGNHEFDYGMEQFQNLAKKLTCGYISCNFRNATTGQLILQPYQIMTYGDVKVAYVGIITPESFEKSNPASFMDSDGKYIFDFDGDTTGEKLYTSVQKAVDDAREQGADFVIAVGHLGEFTDITTEWTAQFVVEHTKGIDAFIDGHSHEVTPSYMQKNIEGKEIPITQSGTRLEYIGQVTIGKDGSLKTEIINSNQVPSKDPNITSFIEKIKSSYQDKLEEVLGHTEFNLYMTNEKGKWIIQKKETNLANLVLDAFLSEAKEYGGADIALCNSGSIRASLPPGNIIYNDTLHVLPSNIGSCIYDVPGQTILDVLEMGARKFPDYNSGLLHTAGLTYSIDPYIPSTVTVDENNVFVGVSGDRRVHNVMVNNEPLDPDRTYRVITNNSIMRKKEDGFVFNGKELVNTNFALPSDLFINYIRKLNEIPDIYRIPQGRLTFARKGKSKIEVLMVLPMKISFEGLTSLPFNDNMKTGEVKEFPFKLYSGQDIIPEDTYTLSLVVKSKSSHPEVAEFSYDEKTKMLKLIAKSVGVTELAIQYSAKVTIPTMNEYITFSQSLGIFTITVDSDTLNDKENNTSVEENQNKENTSVGENQNKENTSVGENQ